MNIKQHIWAFLLCAFGAVGCIKEKIYDIPTVTFNVDWSGISAASKGSECDSVYVYLYPHFDYEAEPIVVRSCEARVECQLLPGFYDVIVHNAPLSGINKRNELDCDNFEFYVPPTSSDVVAASSCGMLHLLAADDPMRSVEITTFKEQNTFTVSPITVTKQIKFKIKTTRFGDIKAAYGVLSGVSTMINARTWKLSEEGLISVRLPNFTVTDSTLTGGKVNVLGFNPSPTPKEDERISLKIYVSNTEVDYELEQEIDLTESLKDLVGDEIEIVIVVPFNPATNAFVEVNQWLAGTALEIGMS